MPRGKRYISMQTNIEWSTKPKYLVEENTRVTIGAEQKA